MGINPPSLYAAFGNKAQLFMEAVGHYERLYWDDTRDRISAEPDVHAAIGEFSAKAARILTTPDAPCGCVVVMGAINVPAGFQGVADATACPGWKQRTARPLSAVTAVVSIEVIDMPV